MIDRVKNLVRPPYFLAKSKQADYEYDAPTETVATDPDAPQHILLIVVDALRPDSTPRFDGLNHSHAIAPSPWTFPSVTSVHTGRYPHDHGSVAHTSPDDTEYTMPARSTGLDTLPERLERAGYETFAGCAFPVPFLALRGWYRNHRVYPDAPARKVVDRYRQWRSGRERTFAYLHLADLHAPIEPSARYAERRGGDSSISGLANIGTYCADFDPDDFACRRFREQRLRLYHAANDYIGDELKRLWSAVGSDTLSVLIGDHGEAQWEHAELDRRFTDSWPNYGVGHGGTPLDAVARVPVGVSDPDLLPTDGTASLVDLPRTIAARVTDDHDFGGYDWSEGVPNDRIALCEGSRYGAERKAAYQGTEKVIRSKHDDAIVAATIDRDGEEFGRIPRDVETHLLDALSDAWEDWGTHGDTGRVVRDQLEALGYR